MAANPFFRGPNVMDWLFAILLQTAVDYGGSGVIEEVANQFGFQEQKTFSFAPLYDPLGAIAPPVSVVVCTDYVFVVSGSTQNNQQWIGNLLGSPLAPFPPSPGLVPTYFGAVCNLQINAALPYLSEHLTGRQVVFIGFSLGAASASLWKAQFEARLQIPTACIALGSPRPGDNDFAAGFPSANFAGIQTALDLVPSVPPTTWLALGGSLVTPILPPLCSPLNLTPTFLLRPPDQVTEGHSYFSWDLVVGDVINGLPTFLVWHNQRLYATILRSSLPPQLTDGYDGYPNAGTLDAAAASVFFYLPDPWPWEPTPQPQPLKGDSMIQLSMYFRDNTGIPLGFQEITYWPGTDPSVPFNLATAGQAPGQLCNMRCAFLSSQVEIFAVRASLVRDGGPLVRQSYLAKFASPATGGAGPMTTIEDAIAFDAWNADRTSRRQFHFRGIDASWLSGDKLSDIGQRQVGAKSSMQKYLNFLISQGIVMNTQKGSSSVANILSASQTAQGTPIVLTISAPLAGIGTPPLVINRGVRQAPLLNGNWQVSVNPTTPTLVTLLGSGALSAPPVISGTMRVLSQTQTTAVSVFTFSQVGKKNTGRPGFLQRGRRPAQLHHR